MMKKTKSMLITTYQIFYKLHIKQLHIFIRDHELEVVRIEKLLGVNIDQNLTWKPHTDTVYKTVSMVLAKFRQTQAQTQTQNSFIQPHIIQQRLKSIYLTIIYIFSNCI